MNALTANDIKNMESGRELDALVAEIVMGWKPRVDFDIIEDMSEGVARYESFSMEVRTFCPSLHISAAWEVLMKTKHIISVNGHSHTGWEVRVGEVSVKEWEFPTAACKAALLAVIN